MYDMVLMAGGTEGLLDGLNEKARFNRPNGLAISRHGGLFVADFGNHAIRKVSMIGEVSLIAGGRKGTAQDGTASLATFVSPRSLTFDSTGNLYVADFGSNKLRRISVDLIVSTLAGSGVKGTKDGRGSDASFEELRSITYHAGYIYAADRYRVRRISLLGQVSSWAGGTESGLWDGHATQARFGTLSAIGADAAGNLFLVDADNVAIRYITPLQKVGTLAGADVIPAEGSNSFLQNPVGLAVDREGNCLVTDLGDKAVKKISPKGVITELYGPLTLKLKPNALQFEHPAGITIGDDGRVYVTDLARHAIYCLIPAS